MVVPLLLLGLGFPPQEAVATSLAVVFLNALSGSLAYMRQGRVLYRMGLAFAAATIPGALAGAWLVQFLGSRWFTILFSLLLLLVAAFLHQGHRLLRREAGEEVDRAELESFRSPWMRLGIAISFGVGILSSLFGIGGGIIHVPFLIVMLGLPVHAAHRHLALRPGHHQPGREPGLPGSRPDPARGRGQHGARRADRGAGGGLLLDPDAERADPPDHGPGPGRLLPVAPHPESWIAEP